MGDQDLELSELEEEFQAEPADSGGEIATSDMDGSDVPDIPRSAQDLEAVDCNYVAKRNSSKSENKNRWTSLTFANSGS